jgi:hypothetical protein
MPVVLNFAFPVDQTKIHQDLTIPMHRKIAKHAPHKCVPVPNASDVFSLM